MKENEIVSGSRKLPIQAAPNNARKTKTYRATVGCFSVFLKIVEIQKDCRIDQEGKDFSRKPLTEKDDMKQDGDQRNEDSYSSQFTQGFQIFLADIFSKKIKVLKL